MVEPVADVGADAASVDAGEADTLANALLNVPAQLDAAFDNLDTILAIIAADDADTRAQVRVWLNGARARINDTMASL